MRAGDGKQFEREIRRFWAMLGSYSQSLDAVGVQLCGPQRAGDRVGCFRGFYVLQECKEVRAEEIAYKRVTSTQTRHLQAVAQSGGIGLVLVKQILGNQSRAWAIPIESWLRLQTGKSTLSLQDGRRPTAGVYELHKARIRDMSGRIEGTPNDLVWDLRPALEAEWLRRMVDQARQHADLLTRHDFFTPIVLARLPELRAELERTRRELRAAQQAYAAEAEEALSQRARADHLQADLAHIPCKETP